MPIKYGKITENAFTIPENTLPTILFLYFYIVNN